MCLNGFVCSPKGRMTGGNFAWVSSGLPTARSMVATFWATQPSIPSAGPAYIRAGRSLVHYTDSWAIPVNATPRIRIPPNHGEGR
jgi:hypothetical protein